MRREVSAYVLAQRISKQADDAGHAVRQPEVERTVRKPLPLPFNDELRLRVPRHAVGSEAGIALQFLHDRRHEPLTAFAMRAFDSVETQPRKPADQFVIADDSAIDRVEEKVVQILQIDLVAEQTRHVIESPSRAGQSTIKERIGHSRCLSERMIEELLDRLLRLRRRLDTMMVGEVQRGPAPPTR